MVLQNTGTYLVNVYSVVKDRRRKKVPPTNTYWERANYNPQIEKSYLLSKSSINRMLLIADAILLCTAT